jgi:hypothetical protein
MRKPQNLSGFFLKKKPPQIIVPVPHEFEKCFKALFRNLHRSLTASPQEKQLQAQHQGAVRAVDAVAV